MGSVLRIAAIAATVCIALSFVMFAADQSEEGSANQVTAVEGTNQRAGSDAAIDRPAPDRATEHAREARHGAFREVIDDVNDVLVTPFTGIADSSNVWVERIVSGLLAALLFGLGGSMLANFTPQRPRKSRDWREATG